MACTLLCPLPLRRSLRSLTRRLLSTTQRPLPSAPTPPPSPPPSPSVPPPLWAVVGLGNPGPAYLHTRHNVGAAFIAYLASVYDLSLQPDPSLLAHSSLCLRSLPRPLTRAERLSPSPPLPLPTRLLLSIPTTYMNLSGHALSRHLSAHGERIPPHRLILVYDDVDLRIGVVKIAVKGGGSSSHNGLRSVIEKVGERVVRVRVGVGRDEVVGDLAAFVLGKFTREERGVLEREVFPRVRAIVEGIATRDVQRVRSLYQGDGTQARRLQGGTLHPSRPPQS